MFIKSFTKTIDEAIDVIRSNLGDTILTNLLSLIVVIGAAVIFGIAIAILAFLLVGMGMAMGNKDSGAIILILMGCFCFFTASIIKSIMESSIIVQIYSRFRGIPLRATGTISKVMSNLSRIVGVCFFKVLGAIPFTILIVGELYLLSKKMLGYNFEDVLVSDHTVGIATLIIIILLVVVNIIIWVGYSICFIYALPGVIIDGLGPIEAIKNGFGLLKGEFFATVKKVILYSLGIYGISMCLFSVLGVVLTVIVILVKPFSGAEGIAILYTVYDVIKWPVQVVDTLLIGAFSPAVVTMLYYSVCCKRQGLDLRLKISDLRSKQIAKE